MYSFNGDPSLLAKQWNTTTDYDGYYISYNDHDVNIYGSDTTAIVIGQSEFFFILNGDHRKEYSKAGDLETCIQYFKENSDKISKYSETLDSKIKTNPNGSLCRVAGSWGTVNGKYTFIEDD